ncbi:glutathione S-transferase [Penicillium canescens]|nr:glutathione S-transferase [Penicillium canescens]
MNDHTDTEESIHLYVKRGSSSGVEIIILLEELQLFSLISSRLPYYLCTVNHIEEIADKTFNFVDIHSHLPILTDIHSNGQRFRLQEPGAIVQYLIAHYDIQHRLSYPASSAEDIEVNNWLFFVASRLGPNHKEAVHFLRSPAEVSYGISRFADKIIQLYLALERHLQETQAPYIVDNKCTVADAVYVSYVAEANSAGVDIEQFPALNSWYNRMLRRPAVARGLSMRQQHGLLDENMNN